MNAATSRPAAGAGIAVVLMRAPVRGVSNAGVGQFVWPLASILCLPSCVPRCRFPSGHSIQAGGGERLRGGRWTSEQHGQARLGASQFMRAEQLDGEGERK